MVPVVWIRLRPGRPVCLPSGRRRLLLLACRCIVCYSRGQGRKRTGAQTSLALCEALTTAGAAALCQSSAFFCPKPVGPRKRLSEKKGIAPRLSVPQCVTRGFCREPLQRGTTLLDEIPGFTGGASGGGGVGNGALLLCCSGFRVEARRRHTRGYDGGGASSLCAFCDSVGCCVAEAQRCCCRPVVGTSCAARPHLKAREHEAADAPTRRTGPVVFGRRRRKT